MTARRITYDTATVHKWTIHDYMVRELDGLKEKITKGDKIDSIINMEPSDFLIMKNQQEMLTSPQLSDYIEKQKGDLPILRNLRLNITNELPCHSPLSF